MAAKTKIDIEYRNGVRATYTVTRVVNSLDPKPGEVLRESQVQDLIRLARIHGGAVTLTEAKQR